MKEQILTCANCNKQQQKMLKCGACKIIFYCNQSCQKNDWKFHKLICCKEKPQIENAQLLKLKIQQYRDIRLIGTGNFSQIFYGINPKNQVVALKQIQKNKIKRINKQADVFMQKHCLNKLKQNPYVVRIFRTFQDQIFLYFQMQYVESGQLWQKSHIFGLLIEKFIKHFFSHIVKAIYLIHKQHIIHRDIKPQNILLTKQNKIKIIDFGTARDLSRPDIKGSGNGLKGRIIYQHYVGTPNYMAPQCVHNIDSNYQSDIFSLAGVLYHLKTGQPMFYGGSQYLIYNKSNKQERYIPSQFFNEIEKDLLMKMTIVDYKKRYQIQDVMKHQYFKQIDFQNLDQFNKVYNSLTQEQIIMLNCVQKLRKLEKAFKNENINLDYCKKKIQQIINQHILQIRNLNIQLCQNQNIKKLQLLKFQSKLLYNQDSNLGIQQFLKNQP